jgi:hypothetical protein
VAWLQRWVCAEYLTLAPASVFCRTDVEVLINQVVFEEPLISDSRKPQLRRLIYSTSTHLCCVVGVLQMGRSWN